MTLLGQKPGKGEATQPNLYFIIGAAEAKTESDFQGDFTCLINVAHVR